MEIILKESNLDVFSFRYDHWKSEEDKETNIEAELTKIKLLTRNYDDYIIIAKSIGILIALLANQNEDISPKMIIAMGVPILFLQRYNYDIKELFENSAKNSKILIIQQENDMSGDIELVRKNVPTNIPLVKIKGHDHAYRAFKSISKYINKIIASNEN